MCLLQGLKHLKSHPQVRGLQPAYPCLRAFRGYGGKTTSTTWAIHARVAIKRSLNIPASLPCTLTLSSSSGEIQKGTGGRG